MSEKPKIDIFQSDLVPKHEIISEVEKQELLKKYNISERQLPKIRMSDPVVKILGAKKRDVIKITRKSPIAGETFYYRIVIP
jgi:DNA-directed RNA polymerase subunit H (RpoH/RPB5)